MNSLLGTGVRICTLVSILVKDIDLVESIVKARHDKNRRQQIVPISRILNKILVEYLQYRMAESEEDVLFCNMHGKKLTVDSCMTAISSFGKRRGVNGCSGAHKFRHTFAKNWILAGGYVFRLQNILGDSSMDM